MNQGVEMPDGSLRFDPGLPVPDVPPGYERDRCDAWRLVPTTVPDDCPERAVKTCIHGRRQRWYCNRKNVYTNTAACCRCQGLIAAPGEVSL